MGGELKGERYELAGELGRGGMGVVYKALDTRLGRAVAVKMIPKEALENADLRRRLAQEARAASALSHPAVATVYDFVEEPQESFIVYEYVEGQTLREKLKGWRFETEEVLEIGVQLADALAAAHERGIVHRDLKPENVMLVQGTGHLARVKILDFGLAKVFRPLGPADEASQAATESLPLTTAGLLVGTVNYMSPEQLEGDPVDHRADIHALGMVLYEMATGSNPFLGKSRTSTMANILRQDAQPVRERNPVVPAELDRIVSKCLRKRREERYQSARELFVDLSNLRRDLAAARPAPASDQVQAGAIKPAPEAAPPLEISRGLARSLFLLIQVAYLIMYAVTFYDPQKTGVAARGPLGSQMGALLTGILFVAAVLGAPLRLYLASAVGFDHANTGRLFRQVFPLVLISDLAWSASPLLLFQTLSLLALLVIPALAYLPFSQRTLVLTAYAPGGGKRSGATPSGSA